MVIGERYFKSENNGCVNARRCGVAGRLTDNLSARSSSPD
jgi:hypothetical protein